jgi:hypothetical protein
VTLRELFEEELDAHHIVWCQGDRWRRPRAEGTFGRLEAVWIAGPCESFRSRSKGRRHSPSGGAWAQSGGDAHEIHLGREVATRYGLQIALHEVAHIVLGHTARRSHNQRVFEREAAAEAWSFQRMEDLGVSVPDKARKRAEMYVAYRKRRGDRVIAARKRTAQAKNPTAIRSVTGRGSLRRGDPL